MTITFQNKGLIDLRAVTTFGVSAKEGSAPIGFFGTGLKYAIACVLRAGGRITLWRGLERYDFSVGAEEIRGKEFGIVQMNGQPLGFTTHLGARWEPWMVFRELHCNTLDEGGETFSGRGQPGEGLTTIEVSGWPAFEDAYAERADIVLESRPIGRSGTIEFHVQPHGPSHIYYRGVRVFKLSNPSCFRYNLTGEAALTEDRTLLYPFLQQNEIAGAVLTCTDERVLERWLLQPKGTAEAGWQLHNLGYEPSAEFLELVGRGRLLPNMNPSAVRVWAEAQGAEQWVAAELRPEEHALLEEALGAVERLADAPWPEDVQLTVVESLGPGCLGRAFPLQRRVVVSRQVFDQGLKLLVGTLFEERLHVTHGFEDCTRDFQNYLLDRLVTVALR